MLKAGYDTRLASGVTCAGGCLGIMIPPSILLIVYAATAGISVVRLYAGAMLPGLLLDGLYIVFVIVLAWFKPQLAPKMPEDQGRMPVGRVLLLLATSFLPLALLIMCVLGSIFFGLATPTEAASVGAFGGLVLAAAYRALAWPRLKEAVYLTARTSAMVCFLFVGSATFASVFSYLGGEAMIKNFVIGLNLDPITFMILAQIIIFLLGWPLEWTEIIIIFVPIFLPLLPHFGIDPIFFGILVALNLQTAFLSPPMAMAAYYLKGVAPKRVTLIQIFNGCYPFLALIVLAMVLVYVFPGLTTWLPNLIYG
jgi:tripartite ATP-independent transporter DctM subunit